MSKQIKNILKLVIIILELLILALLINIIVHYNLLYFLKDINKISGFIEQFGVIAPIAFILLQIIQVILFIIPGEVTGFIGGILFGAFLGTVYTTMGVVLGSYFAFWLARKFGRPFVEKMIGQKYLKKLDSFSETKITFIFFMIFLLPLFPDDIFCFLAGLTKMKTKVFLIIVSIGRFPGYLMLGILGGGLATSQMKLFVISSIICIILLGIVFLFKKRIELFLESK
jgi:uncharacterized membrane protein YdjX (TVP38/TMEM64 family)